MAKTATATTLSPLALSSGHRVYFEDARTVAEMLNYVLVNYPLVHISFATGPAGWETNAQKLLKILFPTGSGWNERFRGKIVVPAETKEITVAARCYMPASNEGQVRFTVGAAAASTLTTFTNATNANEHTATIATSSSGTGEIDVIIEINHTVGGANDCHLRDIRVEEAIMVAADLADPADA